MNNPSDISFVLRAKNRLKVLEALQGKKLISKQIEQATGMYKSHVSRTLTELLKKDFISCINPTDRNFKFYKTTFKGIKVLKEAKQILN